MNEMVLAYVTCMRVSRTGKHPALRTGFEKDMWRKSSRFPLQRCRKPADSSLIPWSNHGGGAWDFRTPRSACAASTLDRSRGEHSTCVECVESRPDKKVFSLSAGRERPRQGYPPERQRAFGRGGLGQRRPVHGQTVGRQHLLQGTVRLCDRFVARPEGCKPAAFTNATYA